MPYVLVLMTVLALQGAAPATTGNWPQWRGPSQDGVSRETGLPSSWGAKCLDGAGLQPAAAHASDLAAVQPQGRGRGGGREGRPIVTVSCSKMDTQNVAWKLPLPAYSGSTPIIWGNTIFLNMATAANTGALELWAVDRAKQTVLVETSDCGREPHGAQAEHVVAVAGHRWPHGVGDDRRRHAQGVRLRRQGIVVAQHPGRLRQVRAELGLRFVAAATRRRALRAGAAWHEDGRPVLRDEDRWSDGEDHLARRAVDRGRKRIPRLVHHASVDRSRRPRRARDDWRRCRFRATTRRLARNSGAPTS